MENMKIDLYDKFGEKNQFNKNSMNLFYGRGNFRES